MRTQLLPWRSERTLFRHSGKREITIWDAGTLSGVRSLAGLGLGLLLASQMREQSRRIAGWSLLVGGSAATILLAVRLIKKVR